jgi:LPXTG-motif cell wall-anchored protein
MMPAMSLTDDEIVAADDTGTDDSGTSDSETESTTTTNKTETFKLAIPADKSVTGVTATGFQATSDNDGEIKIDYKLVSDTSGSYSGDSVNITKDNPTIKIKMENVIVPDKLLGDYEGTVKDSEYAYGHSNAAAGTYQFIQDGAYYYVIITYTDAYIDYVNGSGNNITADVQFKAQINESNWYNKYNRIKIGNVVYDIGRQYGVDVTKTSQYTQNTSPSETGSLGTVTYTVDAYSQQGSGKDDTTLILNDVLTDTNGYLTYNEDLTIRKYTKNDDGTTTYTDIESNEYTLTRSADGKTFTITELPALGDKSGYEVTYSANVNASASTDSDGSTNVKISAPNTVTIFDSNNTELGSGTDDKPIFLTAGIEKDAVREGDNIKWTITVDNPNHDDLNGWKIEDANIQDTLYMNGGEYTYDTITVPDTNTATEENTNADTGSDVAADDNTGDDTNTDTNTTNNTTKVITLPDTDAETITFTYYTPISDADKSEGSANYSNTATLKNDRGTTIDTATKTYEYKANFYISKSGTPDYTNNKINWTITINNPDGVNIGGYTITDSMLSGAIITSGSDKVSKNGNVLTFNDGVIDTSITITYSTAWDKKTTTTNSVSFTGKDNNSKGSASYTVSAPSYTIGKRVENATASTNYLYKWTIDVDASNGLLNGMVISDTYKKNSETNLDFSNVTGLEVKGRDKQWQTKTLTKGTDYEITDGNIVIKNIDTNSDLNHLTITYYTQVADTSTSESIENTATYTINGIGGSSTATGNYKAETITKNLGSVQRISGYEYKIPWTVDLYRGNGFAGASYTDEYTVNANEGTHTYNNDMVVKYKDSSGSYQTLDENLYTVTLDESSNKFIITFKGDESSTAVLNGKNEIRLEYSTKGIIDSGVAYDSYVSFNNKIYSETATSDTKKYTVQKTKPYTKYDGNNWELYRAWKIDLSGGAVDNTGTIDYSQDQTYVDSEIESDDNYYYLKWHIEVDGGYYGTDNIVLNDTLPTGMSLAENSVKIVTNYSSTDTSYTSKYVDYSNWEIKDSNNNIIDVVSTNENVVTFTIPYSAHGGNKVAIDYTTQISRTTLESMYADSITNGDSTSGSATFTNTVSDDSSGAETESITLEKSYIGKTATSDGKSAKAIYYELDFNPNGDTLNGGNAITLVDTLYSGDSYVEGKGVVQWYDGAGFGADLKSFTVSQVISETEEIPISDYSISIEYDPSSASIDTKYAAQLTIQVPDEKHLKIRYTYHIARTYADDYYGSGITVFNKVKITSEMVTQDVSQSGVFKMDETTSANSTTGGANSLSLKKVDSATYAGLSGAGFTLYAYHESKWLEYVGYKAVNSDVQEYYKYEEEDGTTTYYLATETITSDSNSTTTTSWEWRDNVNLPNDITAETLTSNSNGIINLQDIPDGVIMKAVETAAPAGYLPNSEPTYFYYGKNTNSIISSYPDGINSNSNSKSDPPLYNLILGQSLSITNEKLSYSDITVNKSWSDGNDNHSDDVTVKLYSSHTPPLVTEDSDNGSSANTVSGTVVASKDSSKSYSYTYNKTTNKLTIPLTSSQAVSGNYEFAKSNLAIAGMTLDWDSATSVVKDSNGNDITPGSSWGSGSSVIGFWFENVPSSLTWIITVPQKSESTSTGDTGYDEYGIPTNATAVSGVESLTLKSANSYTGSFSNLPSTDSEGKIYYYVKETNVPDGYKASYSGNGTSYSSTGYGDITITNIDSNQTDIDITVKKVWKNDSGEDDTSKGEVTFKLYRYTDDKSDAEIVKIDDLSEFTTSNKTYEFTDLPLYKGDGDSKKLYHYYVVEESVEGYNASYSSEEISSTGEIKITNTPVTVVTPPTPDTAELTLEKSWVGESGSDSVTYEIYRMALDSTKTLPSSLKIVNIGDSITLGSYNGVEESNRYPKQLETLLKSYGTSATCDNQGVDGVQITYMTSSEVSAVTSDTDIVCILGGTNDIHQSSGVQENTDEIKTRLQALIAAVKEKNPYAVIFLGSIPHFQFTDSDGNITTGGSWWWNYWKYSSDLSQLAKVDNGLIDEANTKIKALAEETEGVYFVDVCAAVDEKTMLKDGCHPNEDGYLAIATAYANAINSYYKSPSTNLSTEPPTNAELYQTVTINSSDDWSKTITVDKKDSSGNSYIYYVKETNVPNGYTASYSGNGVAAGGTLTVTNTKQTTKFSLYLRKIWSDDSDHTRDTVTVKIYRSTSSSDVPTAVLITTTAVVSTTATSTSTTTATQTSTAVSTATPTNTSTAVSTPLVTTAVTTAQSSGGDSGGGDSNVITGTVPDNNNKDKEGNSIVYTYSYDKEKGTITINNIPYDSSNKKYEIDAIKNDPNLKDLVPIKYEITVNDASKIGPWDIGVYGPGTGWTALTWNDDVGTKEVTDNEMSIGDYPHNIGFSDNVSNAPYTFTIYVKKSPTTSSLPRRVARTATEDTTTGELVQTVELTASQGANFETTVSDLDMYDPNNQPYYYWAVEEEVQGYTASYLFDEYGAYYIDATQGGTITIQNTKKESSDTVMPSTGGEGVQKYYLTGMAIMLVSAAGYIIIRRRKNAVK